MFVSEADRSPEDPLHKLVKLDGFAMYVDETANFAPTGQDAVAAAQRHATPTGQGHGLADPEPRIGAGDLRVLHDGVKAGGLAVERIRVPRGSNQGESPTDPVEVSGKFDGAESGGNRLRTLSQRMPRIPSKGAVER